MSRDLCDREFDVFAAIDADRWSHELLTHLAGCETCRQVRVVGLELAACLREEAALPVPAADDLWWRARLDARREARQRSVRPLATVERAEPFVALAAVLLILTLRGDVALDAVGRWLPGDATSPTILMAMPSLVVPVVVGGLIATALMLLVGIGAVLSRD